MDPGLGLAQRGRHLQSEAEASVGHFDASSSFLEGTPLLFAGFKRSTKRKKPKAFVCFFFGGGLIKKDRPKLFV